MNKKFLCVVPDSDTMTRDYFANLLQKFRHHRNISFGFSKKHTLDIMAYRKNLGIKDGSTLPGNLYSLPVKWDTEQTYVQ